MIVYLYPVILLLEKIYKEIIKEVLNFFFNNKFSESLFNFNCLKFMYE